MITKQGQIEKMKLIATDPPLVYFQLQGAHCLIARHALTFFAEAKPGMQVLVWGKVNRRGQFIVKDYRLFGKTQLMLDFELSPYPSRKRKSLMKARELLTALTLPQKKQTYQGIGQLENQKFIPITQIKLQEIGLVFVTNSGQAPLAIKDLLTILMTHRGLSLYLQTPNKELKPIYGFKEQEQQILL